MNSNTIQSMFVSIASRGVSFVAIAVDDVDQVALVMRTFEALTMTGWNRSSFITSEYEWPSMPVATTLRLSTGASGRCLASASVRYPMSARSNSASTRARTSAISSLGFTRASGMNTCTSVETRTSFTPRNVTGA